MKLQYKLILESPEKHFARVEISGVRPSDCDQLSFFLPSWSPGSYLMREYGRNLRGFMAQAANGEVLYFKQADKGVYCVDWKKSQLKKECDSFTISYSIYCHELTVRTSHIDASHAFIHGPSVFMGVLGQDLNSPTLAVIFPASWSKISTGLKDISPNRESFIYCADNYDQLIDTPLEIGCHETDGFQVAGKDHELAFYGDLFPHSNDLKKDIKHIVEYVSGVMGEIPYDKYTFITHFVPGHFGGLEHNNSTALIFDGTCLEDRKAYVNWLALVAHEYFHTWNIKRIRPIELGPFDYLTEAKTTMLWLAEGLTSLMDELFVYRSGLCTLEEYLKMQTGNINRYLSTPGKRFHSLEDSSYNAWIKLYRPDENGQNSSISYYLKGGIAFFVLQVLFWEKKKDMTDLLQLLWSSYKAEPSVGLTSEEVYQMVEEIAGEGVRQKFESMITTTEDLDLEACFKKIGLEFEYDKSDSLWLGLNPEYKGERVFIKSVVLDGPAFKSGLNAGDEIIAINDLRYTKKNFTDLEKYLMPNKTYCITVSRLNKLQTVDLVAGKPLALLKGITIADKKKAEKCLLV
ncbi:MAG: M61 family metallopeptidase [Halobacteriovoraceae bacterium]|jgi:predicted metalloprotease with PDZ domain|nr:M61 family metallopeptidase [Halobacteriovoraceae bacterium]MBT5095077.1 M61 family metallopeptidase [Halobacteriovoraceae bacterium]